MPRIKRPASRRAVVGLDIQPGSLRAVQVSTDGRRLVVERTASAALAQGVVRDGEVVDPEALSHALRALFDAHDLDRHVRIGVANQRIVVRHLLVPPISDAKQLATAVRFLAADELPMPIDQAALDHVVIGPVETPDGMRTKVLVVAARRSMVDELLAAARTAGLRPVGIDLAAFAMMRAHGAGGEGTTLHLAVGGVVNLAVSRGGECVFTRVVGGGMEAMAIELAERDGVTIDEARAALQRVRLGDAEPEEGAEADTDAHARTVLNAGLRRIAGEVRNSIDFHLGAETAAFPAAEDAPHVERVLLTGAAVGVSGFSELLSQRLSLPVETPDIDGVDADGRGLFAVAAGLAVEEVAA